MTFPLKPGCRIVCKADRKAPRFPTIATVVRMALSAVAHGADACELSLAVGKAVGCQSEQCDAELQALGDSAAAIREAQDGLDELLDRVKDEFELKVEPELKNESFTKKLLKRLNFARRAVVLLGILWDFIEAVEELSHLNLQYHNDVQSLVDCMTKAKQ